MSDQPRPQPTRRYVGSGMLQAVLAAVIRPAMPHHEPPAIPSGRPAPSRLVQWYRPHRFRACDPRDPKGTCEYEEDRDGRVYRMEGRTRRRVKDEAELARVRRTVW